MKFSSALKLKLIYVFRINDEAHKGCLKIGEATADNGNIWELGPNSKSINQAAKKRIDQITKTAGIAYDLLYTELAIYNDKDGLKSFSDHEVHKVLVRSGVKRKEFDKENQANEWFITDLETVKKAIAAVKEGKSSLHASEVTEDQTPIIFRPEQKEAIVKTAKQFKKGNEMLWFAKMRFGKTLTALQVIKEHEFEKTLIITHRPVVDKGWFEDFGKIFYDRPNYSYGSKNIGDKFSILENNNKTKGTKYVYFASIQDLRGSELVGGNFDKNDEIFSTSWDFIIVDEAHEGTQTELGNNVLRVLKRENTKVLQLSGTPFNLLSNYKEDEIYTWDYVMEQKAKADWDLVHFGDHNPYSTLPKLNIFTYDLGKLISKYKDEEIAFNFREFFRVNELGKFLHEEDVRSFLNLISKEDSESDYPYSTLEYRENFRHTLWMVPGVKEAKALSEMLKLHPVFSHFNIVNVAGKGDEEETNEEALSKVDKAITDKPHETYSITLSCGRLTTGVSIKAWTAVFMLAGSHNTSAASYMQTIFRVQTPATINGKVKEECFVFDFAPDRTLKVIAETAKFSAKVGKTTRGDRELMGQFLNFCPIIAIDGSKMTKYDVNGMVEQLKKVYVERVVRNGFEDGYLYNDDQLMKLNSIELEEFDGLKKIIGSIKAMPKSGDIDINKQGFTDEEYEQFEAVKNKKKKELTEEDKQRLSEQIEKKKNRDSAISILRGISIRMPLLIYGTDLTNEETEINIDNFADLVDDKSWEEFMPKGVTKETFLKFKKYYEPDVFRAAGKRIRSLTKAADNLSIEERIERITSIFVTFRNPDKETVLTPWRVVNMHLGDCLGGYVFLDEKRDEVISQPIFANQGDVTEEVFSPNSLVLEINSKSGLYPLYVSYSIYRNRVKQEYPNQSHDTLTISEQQRLWDTTVSSNVFVICKTPMAKSITKRTLVGFRSTKVNTRYFEDMIHQIANRPDDFIKKVRKGKSFWKSNNNDDMRFNAIVGNPPYQISDGGSGTGISSKPLYHKFVTQAIKLNPRYLSMIIPARWFAGGKGLDDFRETMLNDNRLKNLIDFSNSKDCFPGVNIAGGVCYFLWDSEYTGDCSVVNYFGGNNISMKRKLNEFNILIRNNIAIQIIKKIQQKSNQFMSDYVATRNAYGFVSSERGSENRHQSSLRLISSGGIGYVSIDEVKKNIDTINKFKVTIGKVVPSNGEVDVTPEMGYKVITKPKIHPPGEIFTESYMLLSSFDSLTEAENFVKYMVSKFTRFLLKQTLTSMNIAKDNFMFVPKMDWTMSYNDEDLYNYFELTIKEKEYIEKIMRPFDMLQTDSEDYD